MNLLEDAGQAVWVAEQTIQITMLGYDFLNVIDKDSKNSWEIFIELSEAGTPYVNAVQKFLGIIEKLIV